MDAGTIGSLISNLGVPVAFSLITMTAIKYVYDTERAKAEALHKEDCERLDKTIDKIGDLTLAVKDNSDSIRELINVQIDKENDKKEN